MGSMTKGAHALRRRFVREEGGATFLTFGLFLTLLLGGMGISMDITMAKQTHSRAQDTADVIAAKALTFVQEQGRMPTRDDGAAYANNVVYSARDAGFNFGSNVENDVKFTVEYSRDDRVHVRLWGSSKTTLSAAFGYDEINFEVQSVAENKPKNLQ